jgi:DinB superfamily
VDDVKYPIGKFAAQNSYTDTEIKDFIGRIESLPARLRKPLITFSDLQFDTPYRDGGWTVRQLVHHIADSHLNAYIRIKWTLTEPSPTIKAYNEKLWATTPEVQGDPSISLDLISAHHRKWVSLLRYLSPADLEKHFIHPETGKEIKLKNLIALYAWHGDHHLAHITKLKERLGW